MGGGYPPPQERRGSSYGGGGGGGGGEDTPSPPQTILVYNCKITTNLYELVNFHGQSFWEPRGHQK